MRSLPVMIGAGSRMPDVSTGAASLAMAGASEQLLVQDGRQEPQPDHPRRWRRRSKAGPRCSRCCCRAVTRCGTEFMNMARNGNLKLPGR